MTDLEKTVKIIFGGDTKNLDITITSVNKKLDDMVGGVGKLSAPFANVADMVFKLDAALALLATAGIAIAIKAAGDFNGKFGEITTLISDTGAPIDKFKNDIKGYAVDSVKSIDDINQAIYTSISAGVDYKDSLKFVNEAEKLSVAGRSELGATTKVLISVLNAYGKGTEDAAHYSDIMFTTVKLGLTTMEELSSSLSMVTGLAANADIPFETLSAAIAALTTAGMPTSQAITSIKAAIQNIIKPTSEAEKMAASLGLQFDAAALKTKGFETVLKEAWIATEGDTAKMAELFGSVEALNGVLVLAADKTGKFKSSLEEMGNAAGATQVAYDKVANEFANINQRMENSFKSPLAEIGDKFMPQYAGLADGISEIFKGIKVGVDEGAFDPIFEYLTKVGGELAEKLKLIAANLPEAMKDLDFSGLIKSLEGLGGALGEAFKSLFGEVDLNTAEGLHDLLNRIIKAFTKLIEITTGVVDGMQPLFKSIGLAIDGFESLDSKSAEMIGTLIGAGKAISVLAEYAGILTGALSILAGKAMIDAVSGVVSLGASAVKAVPALAALITNLSGLSAFGAAGAAFAVGGLIGSLLSQTKVVTEASQGILGLLDVSGNYFGALPGGKKKQEEINAAYEAAVKKHAELASATKDTTAATGALGDKVKQTTKDVNDIPESKETIWTLKDAAGLKDEINKINDMFVKAGKAADEALSKDRFVSVGYIEDENGRKHIMKKIDDAVPKEKNIDVGLKADKLKEDSKLIETAIEWKAKLDIAQVEAGTQKMKIMFDSVNTSITSTGSVLSQLFGNLLNPTASQWDKSSISSQIKDENDRRKEAFDLQKKLIEQQITMNKLKIEKMEKGDFSIKLDSTGLEPALEMIMWQIIKKVQIRANESSAEFLLGMGDT